MAGRYPLILAMDTATRCSTVSLTRGTMAQGEVIACLSLSSSITHSRRLISCVDHLFRETEIGWEDIDAIAVGLGPGSFTGLRIGMATAKGFAAAADKHLAGVPTLDALAAMCATDKPIQAVMDARKKQVYTATYQFETEGCRFIRTSEIEVVFPNELGKRISKPTMLVGDGIATYGGLWQEQLGKLVSFAPSQLHFPSATAVGLLCGKNVSEEKYLDITQATPVYVRASDAELSLADKKKSAKMGGEKK
ncbi:MAG: tRNA (adenosine(37)-N6)-threonylcarbamoyltransferase complex dimerization subunit type 1 TsaB [Desulfocapsaceae bacterium]|nr:tRNA (adenosine(37)-N6)-threonylcarbamoyltransferase complex dimerization subunit type 1 TsaB [Desulfocapsaceae bacterium]